MIAPLALVVDVHALLALAAGLDHRPVAIEDGFGEERGSLLPPDLQTGLVEDLLQAIDVACGEAAAEVAGGGRIGQASRAQGVEIGFVAAHQFQMLQARAACQEVVGDREHVVRLVIGQVNLQQLQLPVDCLVEPNLLHEKMHRADASGDRRSRALGKLVVDVRGGHHRPVAAAVVVLVEPPHDPPLASLDLFSYPGVHSKTLRASDQGICHVTPLDARAHREFSSFLIF